MKKLIISLLGVIVGTALLVACSDSDNSAFPDRTTFTKHHLYPEGIAYYAATNEFFVTSLGLGQIGAVNRDGAYRQVVQDADLISVIGIKYDADRKSILACNSHPGVSEVTTTKDPGSVAQLMIYDPANGSRQAMFDLAALRTGVAHFCNDMVTDPAGNIYVTDSFSPLIYRITPAGTASIFAEDARFASPDPGNAFGLNGIVFHPDGYLLVNHMAGAKLFKVQLSTKLVSEVTLTADFAGADGMLMLDPGTIVVVKNGLTGGAKEILKITSTDGWASARTSASAIVGNATPTTATLVGSDVFVVDGRLVELFDGQGPRSDAFDIYRAKFQ